MHANGIKTEAARPLVLSHSDMGHTLPKHQVKSSAENCWPTMFILLWAIRVSEDHRNSYDRRFPEAPREGPIQFASQLLPVPLSPARYPDVWESGIECLECVADMVIHESYGFELLLNLPLSAPLIERNADGYG